MELPTTILRPTRGWVKLELGEVWSYRELLWFLALRDFTVRYRQTFLGAAWAVLQPLSTVIVFTVFFGRVARIPSEGLPYAIFSMSGLLAWNLFSGCLARASGGLLGQASLITKVYFPRLVVPISSVLVTLPDVLLSVLVLGVLMASFGVAPAASVVALPLLLGGVLACGLGFGLWVSALTVRFRDLHHVLTFLTQLWLFVTPVIYPVGAVTGRLEALGLPGWLYGLNPMAGLVAATRALLFAPGWFPWRMLGLSIAVTIVVLVSGAYFFRRTERTFADLI
jgi:lipopolysaccharide transport system permease protein